jgi:integrase
VVEVGGQLYVEAPKNRKYRRAIYPRLTPAGYPHSLRHVFCSTALFTWKLDPTDVSRMAGHANYRMTLEMYVGTTAGVLDRARPATE